MSQLVLRNRQRTRRINLRQLRQIIHCLLTEFAGTGDHELCVHLVSPQSMTELNERFLGHSGPTDVITFNNSEEAMTLTEWMDPALVGPAQNTTGSSALRGEIFICIRVALDQARRFGTTWQSEVVRYAIHGLLHLRGYDDRHPAARRKMKTVENRWLRQLAGRFDFKKLATASGPGYS